MRLEWGGLESASLPAAAALVVQVPTEPPVWADVYDQPGRPLVLDIGCGYGRFLLALRCAGCATQGGCSGRGRGRFLLALRWVLQAARNRWKRLRPRPLPAGPQVQALWLAGGGAGQGRGAAGAPLP